MKTRAVWLVGIILVLAAAFGVGSWRVKNKDGRSQWRLETSLQNPNAYPFITWDDATKGKLGQWLAQKYAQGKLPKFPPPVLPVTGFSATSPDLYEAGGFGLIELTSADFVSSKYRGPDSRPFRLAAFFRTSISGEEYLLLIQQWQNPDGLVWFVPLILPISKAIVDGQVNDYYREITAPDSRYFPAPILRLRGREECGRILSSAAYCAWYFGDEARPLKYEQLAQIWAGGRVPSEMINYPAGSTWQCDTTKPTYTIPAAPGNTPKLCQWDEWYANASWNTNGPVTCAIEACGCTPLCGATGPTNLDAAILSRTQAVLSWTPGTGGVSRRVYVDEDADKVALIFYEEIT